MKKILGLLIGFICVFAISMSAFAAVCETHYGSNQNAHNYIKWATTVKSYLHAGNDGRLMRVQYIVAENKLLAEYYDNSFNKTSQKLITPEYPIFGGIYFVGDNYFVLTGQSNSSESADVVCFAVTKYDKNWNKIATAKLKDCNTVVPFDAGSARFSHSGQYLLIRTCHKMYKSKDGNNHQANVTLQLDMNSMEFTDSFTGILNVSYGYVSHSFNQFIKIDSDKIIALDHGDANPRRIVMLKYKSSVSSGKFVPLYYNTCTSVDMLKIEGQDGDNNTNCSVGGFEITSSGYLAAFNSIDQQSLTSDIRNIYVSYCGKNSDTSVLKQITSYTSSSASTPMLVKISESRFMLLWSYDGMVHYCEVDDKGDIKSNVFSFDGVLSDCQPIIYQNNIIWYVWNDSKIDFYSVSLGNITVTGHSTVYSGHNYQIDNAVGTSVSLKCSECADEKTGKIPVTFSLWWEDFSASNGNTIYFNSAINSSYHPGDTVGLMVKYVAADFNDYEVISDNESVAGITEKYGGFAVVAKSEGSAKITVRSKYNNNIKNTYTLKVAHSWTVKENTAATCKKDGKIVKVCSLCNETKTDVIAAIGHSMGEYSVTKEATCKALGEKKSSCLFCSFYQIEEIPKKEHDKKITIEAEAATCTKQGKTEGKKCSGCGTITVAQETVAALGHNLGKYEITKAPTCTAQGEKTAKCTRCNYTKTEKVARADHEEITVEAIAPTCTKQGKTEGKKCSVCGATILAQESVEALGHELGEYEITKAPTCTAQGEKTAKCTRCNYTKTEKVARADHEEITVEAIAPTCTKQGKTEGKKCSVCGATILAQESVEALGHELGEYEITRAPTCTAQGEETAKCTRCSYTKTEKVARIDHKEIIVEAIAPTCTKQGKTEGKKCSVCSATILAQESVEALGHELGEYEITKAPTCTAQGEEAAQCTRCSYTKTEKVARIDHKEIIVEAIAPTCTKQGKTEGKKCSVCSATIVTQTSVEALGHDLGEYEITKEPTCTAKGKKTAQCNRCSYTETDDIEKVAHTEVIIEAVAPTCTKSGKTEGKKCTVCDKVTAGQESIAALGHNKNITVLAVATVEANGKISTACDICGEYFGEQRVYRIKSVSLSSTKCTYNGKSKTPTVTVVDYNKDTLIKDRDYTVNYESSRKAIGKYSVVVKFIGKYSGSETRYYEILPGKTSKITATQSTNVIRLKWNAVKGANGYRIYQYDSKSAEYKQIASVKNVTEYRIAKLKAGKNYKFAVMAYFKSDSGKVYFSDGKKAISTATEPDVPTASLKVSGKTAAISWNKISGADGYQVYYSTSKNGEYKKLKSTSELSLKKIGLTFGKTYYFKVRAYKKTSAGTVYGGFSKVQSIKIK